MRNQNHQRTYQKIQNEDNGGLKHGKDNFGANGRDVCAGWRLQFPKP